MHRLAVGIYDDDGTGSWCGSIARNSTSRAKAPKCLRWQGVSRGKLILVNDDDLTYCSLRLDPESLQTVSTRIADIAEPLPRTLAWSAAWEMTREAELKARDFVALVSAACTPKPKSVWPSGCCCRRRPRSVLRRAGLGVRERLAAVR